MGISLTSKIWLGSIPTDPCWLDEIFILSHSVVFFDTIIKYLEGEW